MAQDRVPLYPADAVPFAKQGADLPSITIYQPKHPQPGGKAVIVCSGGAYIGRANDVEGIPACKKLSTSGITAILLDYRVPRADMMESKEWVPFTDAQRAIQFVREHAAKYKLNKHQVGIMGFSAGGHLVATVGTRSDTTQLRNPLHTSLRPDFMILVYPVISFADSLTHWESRNRLIGPDISPENIAYYSNELHVTKNTPPAFITHGLDDEAVKSINSLYFAAALQQHHVPVKLFLYTHGAHGYGIYNKGAMVQWIDDCIDWINQNRWKLR